MTELDKRIECVLDVLYHKAGDTQLEVEHTFDDDVNSKSSVIVRNSEADRYGIIAVNVDGYLEEPICFFLFHNKQYQYCKMEGFELSQMLSGYPDKIFEKTDIKSFFDFILDDK